MVAVAIRLKIIMEENIHKAFDCHYLDYLLIINGNIM